MAKDKKKTVKPLFGSPIEEETPEFVLKAISFLEENALEEEGLFRVPGDNSVIQQSKKELNEGQTIDFDKVGRNVHNIASLLKLYFRELPIPLLTFDFYDMFIAAEGVPEPTSRMNCIKKVLSFIPEPNMKLLKNLCRFLNKVMQHKDVNKMHSSNLAIVFAPNLLRPEGGNGLQVMTEDSKYSLGLMKTLIEEYEFIFENGLTTFVEKDIKRYTGSTLLPSSTASSPSTPPPTILEKPLPRSPLPKRPIPTTPTSVNTNPEEEEDSSDSEEEVEQRLNNIANTNDPKELIRKMQRLSVRLSTTNMKPLPPPKANFVPTREPVDAFAAKAEVMKAKPIQGRVVNQVLPPPSHRATIFGNSNFSNNVFLQKQQELQQQLREVDSKTDSTSPTTTTTTNTNNIFESNNTANSTRPAPVVPKEKPVPAVPSWQRSATVFSKPAPPLPASSSSAPSSTNNSSHNLLQNKERPTNSSASAVQSSPTTPIPGNTDAESPVSFKPPPIPNRINTSFTTDNISPTNNRQQALQQFQPSAKPASPSRNHMRSSTMFTSKDTDLSQKRRELPQVPPVTNPTTPPTPIKTPPIPPIPQREEEKRKDPPAAPDRKRTLPVLPQPVDL